MSNNCLGCGANIGEMHKPGCPVAVRRLHEMGIDVQDATAPSAILAGLPFKESMGRLVYKRDEHPPTFPPQEGHKADTDKPRMDLIPPEAIEQLAAVLTMGAAKYEDRNWEKGFAWGRSVAALLRHLFAWMRGQDKDPESGLSHLAHVLCNAAFLVTFEARGIGTDDRAKQPHKEP